MSYVTRLEPLFAALTVFLKSVIKSGCGLGTDGWDWVCHWAMSQTPLGVKFWEGEFGRSQDPFLKRNFKLLGGK